MSNFERLCLSITMPDIPDISDDETVTMDQAIAIENVSIDIKGKLNYLDRISIMYIEEAFRDVDNVVDRLKKTGNEDIPDGVLNCFANKIYAKPFNQLSQKERAIISVLSVYILI